MTSDNKDMLDDLFAQARQEPPQPSGAFLARLEAQALEAMPAPTRAARPGLWQQVLSALGGWPGAAGLAAASAAGLWIGIDPPLAVDSVLNAVSASGTWDADPLTDYDFAFLEG